ncbi:MAG: VOC family protein [bacterium]|nr:VOC family protein [bacterium]
MVNEFCWVEMTTDDPNAAKGFYRDLFGWKYEEMPMEGGNVYSMFQPETGGPGGGIMAKPCEDAPTAWMPYVGVDDLVASVERVKELGGVVHMGPMPVAGHGEFAVIADPTGGVLGLWHSTKTSS